MYVFWETRYLSSLTYFQSAVVATKILHLLPIALVVQVKQPVRRVFVCVWTFELSDLCFI